MEPLRAPWYRFEVDLKANGREVDIAAFVSRYEARTVSDEPKHVLVTDERDGSGAEDDDEENDDGQPPAAADLAPMPTEYMEQCNRGRHADLIAHLTERYGSGGLVLGESSSGDDHTDGEGGGGGGGGGGVGIKRKAAAGDCYESDDSFIDDGEIVAEVTAKVAAKRIKTKDGGFFVASKDFEIVGDVGMEAEDRARAKVRKRATSPKPRPVPGEGKAKGAGADGKAAPRKSSKLKKARAVSNAGDDDCGSMRNGSSGGGGVSGSPGTGGSVATGETSINAPVRDASGGATAVAAASANGAAWTGAESADRPDAGGTAAPSTTSAHGPNGAVAASPAVAGIATAALAIAKPKKAPKSSAKKAKGGAGENDGAASGGAAAPAAGGSAAPAAGGAAAADGSPKSEPKEGHDVPWRASSAVNVALASFGATFHAWLLQNPQMQVEHSSDTDGAELSETFPRTMDFALAHVDALVQQEHPDATQSQGYFESLGSLLHLPVAATRRVMERLRRRTTLLQARQALVEGDNLFRSELAHRIRKRQEELDAAGPAPPAFASAEETNGFPGNGGDDGPVTAATAVAAAAEPQFVFEMDLRSLMLKALNAHDRYVKAKNDDVEGLDWADRRAAVGDEDEALMPKKERDRLLAEWLELWPASMGVDGKYLRKMIQLERNRVKAADEKTKQRKAAAKAAKEAAAAAEAAAADAAMAAPLAAGGASGASSGAAGAAAANDDAIMPMPQRRTAVSPFGSAAVFLTAAAAAAAAVAPSAPAARAAPAPAAPAPAAIAPNNTYNVVPRVEGVWPPYGGPTPGTIFPSPLQFDEIARDAAPTWGTAGHGSRASIGGGSGGQAVGGLGGSVDQDSSGDEDDEDGGGRPVPPQGKVFAVASYREEDFTLPE